MSSVKTINLNRLLMILLLIPFFEFQSYSMFADNGVASGMFNLILDIYSLGRLFITMLIFIKLWKDRIVAFSHTSVGVLVFVILMNLTSAFNESLFINYIIGSVSFLGLALLCQIEIQNNAEDFIWSCKFLFGFLSVIGAMQIISMPYGFLDHPDKAFAIYLLGGKNTSFFYYAVFIFFLLFDDLRKYGKIRKRCFVFLMLFILAALRCDSMNTLMMMLVISAFAVVVNYGVILRKFVRPPVIIAIVLMIAAIILVPQVRVLLNPALHLIGRNASFTGRDVLWVQAIRAFIAHPFIGNGIFTKFRLDNGVWQDNAHSQFLDLLAKYGVFVFLSFVLMPVFSLIRAFKKDKGCDKVIALKCAICFMILFHSVVDHMVVYHYILLMVSVEMLSYRELASQADTERIEENTDGTEYPSKTPAYPAVNP